MKGVKLPESITSLVEHLQIVQMTWQGVAIQIPRFAVYALLSKPVFDQFIMRKGRKIALLQLARYKVPILDPFRGHIDPQPNYVLIISHCRDNRFGLYGYPADSIEEGIDMPFYHGSVSRIVKDFV
jgi:hypothetical protein